MPTHSLEIAGLTLDRGSKRVVDSFDLSLAPGEYCVVLGPSGCGKSTLLHGIAGLISVARGSITIDGTDVTHEAARKRNVGLLFQHDTMYPHLTVQQTLQIAAQANPTRNLSATQLDQQIRVISETMNLDPGWLPRRPDTLSGGQRRRVALAKTLIRNPSVCLLDEPMAAIDRLASERLMERLADVSNQAESTTFVHVTHDGEEAMRLADKIVVMSEGQILQVGSPGEIYRSPNSSEVALALGSPSCNLLSLREVIRACPQIGEVIELPDGQSLNELVLLLRPETIQLLEPASDQNNASTATESGEWQFPAIVLERRNLGGRTLLRLQPISNENAPPLSVTIAESWIPAKTGTRWIFQTPISKLRVVAGSPQHTNSPAI
ncbi:ABC transporter ATP-binding protein [Rhodopirellula bahusiensis]|uniref:Sugar ABC transporter n=1 Tax=Rhodopirellula bahusiensis TaxID=2014065 RepID=A0A2G1W928_9BACT|nr:ABC transporter ATP-binding protein [Rhodopirellula bahusiensis]PHQ35521.1 sugar ABC transporter [Rhodopirellula bahusiensis]